jgi:hypothetical protein
MSRVGECFQLNREAVGQGIKLRDVFTSFTTSILVFVRSMRKNHSRGRLASSSGRPDEKAAIGASLRPCSITGTFYALWQPQRNGMRQPEKPRLALRRTWPDDPHARKDWSVRYAGQEVGRIYRTSGGARGAGYVWSIYDSAVRGSAETLKDAKAEWRRAYFELRAGGISETPATPRTAKKVAGARRCPAGK